MADFVMLMMGSESKGDWESYIAKLIDTGKFRGGSSLASGVIASKGKGDEECHITGMIRLSGDSLDDVRVLLEGNPLYEAGGRVALLEEIPD